MLSFLHISVVAAHHPNCLNFFFFNDTATTEIYTLSLHDALPISMPVVRQLTTGRLASHPGMSRPPPRCLDRKSTRLNSSHGYISYAVFCLKKKKKSKKSAQTLKCQVISRHIKSIRQTCNSISTVV